MAAPRTFNLSHWGNTQNNIQNNVWDVTGSGAPVNGTSGTGAGQLGPGSSYTDIATGIVYYNTNTQASPTWVNGSTGGTLTTPTITNPTVTTGTFSSPALTTPTVTSPTITELVSSFVAAGSTQADGVAITSAGGQVALVTGANATKGAVLPVAVAGMVIIVVNDAAANAVLKIYGNTGDSATINGTAGSTAYSMVAKGTTIFVAQATAKWQTCPLVSS